MPTLPLVTVIVPNYNHARYLPQRLDTILNQTYSNFEVLILDDASTDGSLEICMRYLRHPRVREVVTNPRNSGSPFCQWHRGLQKARGSLVWIAESDDAAHPDFLASMVDCLRDPHVAMAFCPSILIDAQGAETGRQPLDCVGNWSGAEFARKWLAVDCAVWNASSAVFRRPNFDTSFLCRFKACGDKMLWARICDIGDIFCHPLHLNYFRQHPANTSGHRLADGTRLAEEHAIYRSMRLPPLARVKALGAYLSRIDNWHRDNPALRQRLYEEWGMANPFVRAALRLAHRINIQLP